MLLSIHAVIVAVIALIAWLGVTRGLQLKRLVEDGVDAEGTVIRQYRHNPKGSKSTDYFLRYRYRDAFGAEHEGKSGVGHDFWDAHPEGKPIAISYSKRRPSVSAPRLLVEQARGAMEGR